MQRMNAGLFRSLARARRFVRDARGVVAIEFAALAIPFSLLIFAILESSISFAAQQVLANATDDVARQIRTGQVRASDFESNPERLRGMICTRIEIIVTQGCPGLEVDLRKFDTFQQIAALEIEYTADGDIDTSDFDVAPGGSMSQNTLRVFYRWPVMTDLMRKSMSNLKGGNTLHFASVTWQNEPFDE